MENLLMHLLTIALKININENMEEVNSLVIDEEVINATADHHIQNHHHCPQNRLKPGGSQWSCHQ